MCAGEGSGMMTQAESLDPFMYSVVHFLLPLLLVCVQCVRVSYKAVFAELVSKVSQNMRFLHVCLYVGVVVCMYLS